MKGDNTNRRKREAAAAEEDRRRLLRKFDGDLAPGTERVRVLKDGSAFLATGDKALPPYLAAAAAASKARAAAVAAASRQ